MKRILLILALLGLLLAACGQDDLTYASYAPSGRPFEKLEIQVRDRDSFAETGTMPITAIFTSRTGEVLSLSLKRQGDALFFAQSVPGSGIQENDEVNENALRTVLLDEGIANAGQFKPATAAQTVALVLAFSDPALRDAIVPPQFSLLETNLSVEK